MQVTRHSQAVALVLWGGGRGGLSVAHRRHGSAHSEGISIFEGLVTYPRF